MKWLIKSALFATLLSWPGHLFAPFYQTMLLSLTSLVIGARLSPPADGSVDLSAANMLVVFVSLCLASDFAPWSRRARAIGLGLLILVAIECAAGVLVLSLSQHSRGWLASSDWRAQLMNHALDLWRWLAIPLVWGALIGYQALNRGPQEDSPARQWSRSPTGTGSPPTA